MTLFRYLGAFLLTLTPAAALAQNNASIQNLFTGILNFFDSTLIPFLFGVAFLVFVWNVVKYFVVGSDNKDAQETAKSVALFSVAAFVFLIVFFGIVRLLTVSTGLQNGQPVCPDYLDAQHCIGYVPAVI